MHIISENKYIELAQNGARILFDLDEFRVLDGVKGETESYFLIDFSRNRPRYFQINQALAYEYVTMFYCGGSKDYLLELLFELVTTLEEKLNQK